MASAMWVPQLLTIHFTKHCRRLLEQLARVTLR
ncbi:MAG: hypothetical protein JWO49_970 [Arthrobacter sp.]|nr:hypothetical protein [Arthrobacter sp.]